MWLKTVWTLAFSFAYGQHTHTAHCIVHWAMCFVQYIWKCIPFMQRHCIGTYILIYFARLTIIFPHKSLCQKVNVCYFNFNNLHTCCWDIRTPLLMAKLLLSLLLLMLIRCIVGCGTFVNHSHWPMEMAVTLPHSDTGLSNRT